MEKTPIRVVLAENLKRVRKAAKLSQMALAKRSGVAQTTISNMERPTSEALDSSKLDNVEKVAAAFDLAVWQLLLDPKTVGKEMADMLMRPAVKDDDERLVGWDASKTKRKIRTPA